MLLTMFDLKNGSRGTPLVKGLRPLFG